MGFFKNLRQALKENEIEDNSEYAKLTADVFGSLTDVATFIKELDKEIYQFIAGNGAFGVRVADEWQTLNSYFRKVEVYQPKKDSVYRIYNVDFDVQRNVCHITLEADYKGSSKADFYANKYLREICSKFPKAGVAVNQPIEQPVGHSNLDEIKKLKELLDCGAITQAEFDAKKAELLK